MKKCIAILRGINVGGHRKILMVDLKLKLTSIGFIDVSTYIQSGNVVLESESNPESKIKELIQSNLGFSPEVLALTETEFNSAVINNPYQEHSGKVLEGKYVHFYFCKEMPSLNTEKLDAVASKTERYRLIDKVFYLHAPDGIGRSKMVTKIEACFGVPATGRNLNTVNKVQQMIQSKK